MNSTIQDILTRYDSAGSPNPLGVGMRDEDRNDLREYLIDQLVHNGVPVDEAYKIVQAFYWGSWSEGWDLGYDGARAHFAPGR